LSSNFPAEIEIKKQAPTALARRRGIVVIASASRTEDTSFKSRQGARGQFFEQTFALRREVRANAVSWCLHNSGAYARVGAQAQSWRLAFL
jgi:hypothetical protein